MKELNELEVTYEMISIDDPEIEGDDEETEEDGLVGTRPDDR